MGKSADKKSDMFGTMQYILCIHFELLRKMVVMETALWIAVGAALLCAVVVFIATRRQK